MGKSKSKGTRRETQVARQMRDAGLQAARATNNLPGKDIHLEVDGETWAVEVKDRRQLNIQDTVAHTTKHHPDETPMLVWHRTAPPKQPGGRSIPAGPTLAIVRLDDMIRLLADKEGNDEGPETAAAGTTHGDAAQPD